MKIMSINTNYNSNILRKNLRKDSEDIKNRLINKSDEKIKYKPFDFDLKEYEFYAIFS